MRKFYEKHEVLFAVFWIVAYCVIMAPIKGEYGYGSMRMLLPLIIFAALITVFVKTGRLEEKYGIAGWPKDMKKYFFFIPLFILASMNLWDGISLSFRGMPLVIATFSMILIGYVEEMIFRGFLFKAMLGSGKAVTAIIVSALTFGIGHIVNFLAGQAGFETALQIVFAISWGAIFTMVFYCSGSLIPCIIAHAMIDVFSLYGADNEKTDMIFILVTLIAAVVFCIYLAKINRTVAAE